MPAKIVYYTNGRTRMLKLGPYSVKLLNRGPKTMDVGGRMAPLVFQALRHLGRGGVTLEVIDRLRLALSSKDKAELKDNIGFAAAWMIPVIEQVARTRGTDGSNCPGPRGRTCRPVPACGRFTAPERAPAIIEKDFWVCWALHRLFDVLQFASCPPTDRRVHRQADARRELPLQPNGATPGPHCPGDGAAAGPARGVGPVAQSLAPSHFSRNCRAAAQLNLTPVGAPPPQANANCQLAAVCAASVGFVQPITTARTEASNGRWRRAKSRIEYPNAAWPDSTAMGEAGR